MSLSLFFRDKKKEKEEPPTIHYALHTTYNWANSLRFTILCTFTAAASDSPAFCLLIIVYTTGTNISYPSSLSGLPPLGLLQYLWSTSCRYFPAPHHAPTLGITANYSSAASTGILQMVLYPTFLSRAISNVAFNADEKNSYLVLPAACLRVEGLRQYFSQFGKVRVLARVPPLASLRSMRF
jgi:hypothetical protein